MRDEGKATRVNIFGGEYSIRGEADPEYIRKVATYVDSKMREIDGELRVPSVSKVAILASLRRSKRRRWYPGSNSAPRAFWTRSSVLWRGSDCGSCFPASRARGERRC